MKIKRWLGFEVTENWQARDLRLTKNRPAGLAVLLDIDIPDEMIRQVVSAKIVSPGQIGFYVPVVEAGEDATPGEGL